MNAVSNKIANELRAEIAAEDELETEVAASNSVWGGLREKFQNLPLARKVFVIFGSFVTTLAVMSLIVGGSLADLYTRTMNGVEVQRSVLESSQLQSTVGQLRYNSVRYIFGNEESALERQRESFDVAREQIVSIEQTVDSLVPDEANYVEKLKSDLTEYNGTFEELRASLERSGQSENSIALAYDLSRQGDQLFDDVGELQLSLEAHTKKTTASSVQYFFNMLTSMAGLLLLGAVILYLGLRYLSTDFASKIKQISEYMQRLTEGDYDFKIEAPRRKDEIGEMLISLRRFQRATIRFRQWAKERHERAEKDALQQEEREREREEAEAKKAEVLSNLAGHFERTVGDIVSGVAAASAQLQTTASSMANSADESTQRTSQVSKSMEEANAGATAAAAASDEFAMSIGEISRQAASSAELARQATDSAKEADGTISALSDSAEQVGQIVELIQTIAQRTNLLALNASIEAARGGEAGRGFAVVASEVKELAMQTSRATDEVAEQIRAMQDTTGASVSALRKIAGQIEQLETTAVSIASAVDQQSVAGQDLARSIDIAATSTDEVSTHIADLRELSLTTGAAASQVLSSATDLENQAQTLSAQADVFVKSVRTG
jgi:methyl-accepting chemotaxis protein